MDKIEHMRFLIERFDHNYDSVNNKGAFYIGLNTFIFGGICVGYLTLYKDVTLEWIIWALLIPLMLCSVLSIVFTIRAIMPFLKDNHRNEDNPSLIFFGGIARHELSHFMEKFKAQSENQIEDDLAHQVYCLATGLKEKYRSLKYASKLIVAQFVLTLPLLVLIIKNLEK